MELLDIVNQHDIVTGSLGRSEVYKRNLSSFRVINAFLINEEKQLWIPQRSASKTLFPNCLDASVGGHVMAGESYEDAFIRELKEELNIDAKDIWYRLIKKLTPHNNNVSAFMNIYLIPYNKEPHYNRDDISEGYWLSKHELLRVLEHMPSKSDLIKIVTLIDL